jgi:hypothetical protein
VAMDMSNLYDGATSDFGGDPLSRAALQEAVAQQQITMAGAGQMIPQCYFQQGGSNPLGETPVGAVQGNLPKVGWTCQKDAETPVFGPYAPTGVTPDWTDNEGNALGAGAYDQNQVVGGAFAPNRLNRGPIGATFFDSIDPNDRPNPNAPTTDVSGSGGDDLEW